MNSKALFVRNKELTQQWAAVAHSDWFEQVLLYARSEFMENVSVLDSAGVRLVGAKEYENVLVTLGDAEVPALEPIGTILHHDIDNPRAEKDKKEPESEKPK